jgi:hypothetical protein
MALGQVVRQQLPRRSTAAAPAAAKARQLYAAAMQWLGAKAPAGLNPAAANASRLVETHRAMPRAAAAAGGTRHLVAAGAVAQAKGETMEYRWSRVTRINGHLDGQMLTMQVDGEGRVLRSRVVHCA